MASKIALVTGANKGIGYDIVKALLESSKPFHVLLGSRSLVRGEEAADKLRGERAGSSNTVEALHQNKSGRIEALINNAGLTKDIEFVNNRTSLRDSFTGAYDINVAGTHVLTYTFLPLLLKSADPRLVFVSGLDMFVNCATGDFPLPPDPERGWSEKMAFETVGYRCTKAAFNILMLDYHWKLQKDGVKVWTVLPGFLETDLGGGRELVKEMGAGHPSLGGQLMKRIVDGERD
ncbi:hypothetical protein B0H67DRAFT_647190 [Lasiosphaeris hirsuta]|uniref:NAD(P)-binding protein n=1 Tax=Lasiosphaeris hirsuta TaxID=260670 RepID=A0AA40DSM3_9PEZI|nr:hypothetical protein B0H67DRAFT_647190 [Lasiosphaeris hirsuta]